MELSPCVGWCRAGVWRWCRSNAGEVGWQPREQRLGPHTFPEHPQGRAVAVSAQGEQKGGDGSALSLMRRSSSCECCRQPAPHRRPQPVLIMYPVSLINLLLFFLSFCVFTSFLSLSQGGGASIHLTWGGKVPLAHLVSDMRAAVAVLLLLAALGLFVEFLSVFLFLLQCPQLRSHCACRQVAAALRHPHC